MDSSQQPEAAWFQEMLTENDVLGDLIEPLQVNTATDGEIDSASAAGGSTYQNPHTAGEKLFTFAGALSSRETWESCTPGFAPGIERGTLLGGRPICLDNPHLTTLPTFPT